MPLYEYQCEKCGEQFEVIEKFSDAPLTTHDKCGGAVHRLLSAPALQFKGSGWYITDYAKSGSKSSDNGGSKKSEGSKSGSSPSSDSGSSSSGGESKSSSTPATTETK